MSDLIKSLILPDVVSAGSQLPPPDNASGASAASRVGLLAGRPSTLMLVLTFVASISGFMFGYDTGYISSALVSIGTDFGKELTYGEKQFITLATSLGALIGCIFAGMLADLFGRRPVVMGLTVLFVVGLVIQVAAQTVWTMIAGRFVMGFGVGFGSLIAPLYISEMASSRFRGRLVIINCLCITGGQLIAYGIGAGTLHMHNGWRLLVGLSIIPPVVQFVVFVWLPDTPRYLVSKGREEEAQIVLHRIHRGASPELVEARVAELAASASAMSGLNPFTTTVAAIREIHTRGSNFRALVIGCGLQGIQQFTGFNSLMYFSATIFETIGFKNSTAVSIIVAATNFVFTIGAFFVIDRVGRRPMLLCLLPVMLVALVVCAIAFHYFGVSFDGNDVVAPSNGILGWGIVIVVGMIVYVALYAIGIGNVPWQQSELFPQSVRGVGASYATATNWSGSLVISSTFLTMLQNITPTGTFALFAALTAVSVVFVFFCYPELSGLELEETQEVLTGGFNIKRSQELVRAKRARRMEASA